LQLETFKVLETLKVLPWLETLKVLPWLETLKVLPWLETLKVLPEPCQKVTQTKKPVAQTKVCRFDCR